MREDVTIADALETLLRQHDRLGSPLRSQLRPGVSRGEATGRLQVLGLTAPRTILDWFGRFDGLHVGRDTSQRVASLVPYWIPLTLDGAIITTRDMRTLAAELAPDLGVEAKDIWAASWLAVAQYDRDQLVVDCSQSTHAPVWHVSWDPEALAGPRPICPSLEAWLGVAATALASGQYRWSVDRSELELSTPGGGLRLPRCDADRP